LRNKIPSTLLATALINFYIAIKDIIDHLNPQLNPNSEQGGGSKQNNKGMFNYAHFIPLHNRSKKHNYAVTKIKNNTRHRRRNKSSNRRRSRRS
jgi:hypothetical protein